jgi:hypothetical protein
VVALEKTAELFSSLAGESAGFDAVSLPIGTIWGPLGLPDSPFPTGQMVRYSEVVDAINAAVPGAKITLPEGRNPDRPHNYLDTTRLREDTGFQPEYDVERAVPD